MIVTLLFIAAIVCSFLAYKAEKSLGLVILIVIVAAFMIGAALSVGAIHFKTEFKRVDQRCLVYSLKNETGILGKFVVGTGQIQSTEYYYLFTKEPRGGYQRTQLRARDVILFQDEDTAPYMYWQVIYYTIPKWVSFYDFGMGITEDTLIDLHVPKNTIVEQFKVN